MKYGKFVFECNCGNSVEFSPREDENRFPLGVNWRDRLLVGLDAVGVAWSKATGRDNYMCKNCLESVSRAESMGEAHKRKLVEETVEKCRIDKKMRKTNR